MGMRAGMFGVAECMERLGERRSRLRSLSGVVVSDRTWSAPALAAGVVAAPPAAGPRSAPNANSRQRCFWLRDGRCRQERPGSVLIADSVRRWEIPAHSGPVVVGPRGELLIDRLTDPARLLELRDVRVVDEDARHEGRPTVVVEVKGPDVASTHDRLLTLDAEFGVVLIDHDRVTGRAIRLVDVRFNEELDPGLFVYRPEPWRTLVHAQSC